MSVLNDRHATIVDCAVLRQVLIAYEQHATLLPDAERAEAGNMISLGYQAIEKLQTRAKDFTGMTRDAMAMIAAVGGGQ